MFARLASQVRTTAETLVREKQLETAPTFFEHVTAIALLAFSKEDIDLAILETGLGGRLDATTCAQAEIVALTPIALDHEEYLGETIEKVAFEKAAIIRPGVRARIASQDRVVEEVILRQCELAHVTPTFDHFDKKIEAVDSNGRFCITLKTATNTYERLSLGLRGRHQITNASLAVLIAEALQDSGYTISSAAVVEGVRNAEHPGRLELIAGQPCLLLDGAHNPAGAESLANYLREFGCRPLTIVFAAMRDKKLRQIAEILFPLADQLVLTEVTNPRAADAETLKVLATEIIDPDRIAVTTHSAEALTLALEKTPAAGMVCCTGSLYLIGELRNRLTTSAERKVAKSQTET